MLFSLLLGTLPVILLGIFSYVKSSDMIQQKVNQGNIQILVEKQMRIENMLKVMDNNVIQFICSSIVRDAMNTSLTPDDFQMLNNLSISLSSMQSYELNIRNVNLINLEKGWSISNNGKYHLNLQSDDTALQSYIKSSDTSFWVFNGNDERSSAVTDAQKRNSIMLVKKIPVNSITPSGLVTVEISCSELGKLLYSNDETDEIMLLDRDYNVLVHKGSALIGNGAFPSEMINKIKNSDTPKGNTEIKLGNNSAGFTFTKSAYTGWSYINIVSMKQVTKDSQAIGWFTLFTCLVILALSWAFSLQGSQKIYNPVQKLCDSIKYEFKLEDAKKDRDEFQFIRDRIHSLINTQSQMANTINGQLGQLKELFFFKLLNGKLRPSDVHEKLKLFRYPESMKWFYVLAVKIDSMNVSNYKEQDRDLMMFAINNISAELIPEESFLNSFPIDQFQITLIGSDCSNSGELKNNTFDLAQKLQRAVKEFLHLKISVGISRPFNEYTDMHHAYKEAVEALKQGSLLGQDMVVFREDTQLSPSSRFYFPKELESDLIDAIKTTDAAKAKRFLKQFLVEVFRDNMTFSRYQLCIMRLLLDLLEMQQELGDPFDRLLNDGKQMFDQLFKLKSTQEIENWFQSSIIEPVIQLLKECRGSQYRKISSEVIDMIHKRFDTDLTLETCATVMNYHPSYISRIFSAETGVTFSDYLSKYRLETAKKWLLHSELKIQDISEKLRYNNPQNFIRHFRKNEGMTPGQYRSQGDMTGAMVDRV